MEINMEATKEKLNDFKVRDVVLILIFLICTALIYNNVDTRLEKLEISNNILTEKVVLAHRESGELFVASQKDIKMNAKELEELKSELDKKVSILDSRIKDVEELLVAKKITK